MDNIKISEHELTAIRVMSDFDLTMFLSELHDHGWPLAQKLIPIILDSSAADQSN